MTSEPRGKVCAWVMSGITAVIVQMKAESGVQSVWLGEPNRAAHRGLERTFGASVRTAAWLLVGAVYIALCAE